MGVNPNTVSYQCEFTKSRATIAVNVLTTFPCLTHLSASEKSKVFLVGFYIGVYTIFLWQNTKFFKLSSSCVNLMCMCWGY